MSFTSPPSDFVARLSGDNACKSCGGAFTVNDIVERLSFVCDQPESANVLRLEYHADCLRLLFEFISASEQPVTRHET